MRSRRLGLAAACVEDAMAQLRADAKRHALTLAGIVWGAASIVALLAIGAGFHRFLDVGFERTGDRYTVVYGEHATEATGGGRPGRKIALDRDDVERVRASVGSAAVVAAEAIRSTVAVRTPARTRNTVVSAGTAGLQAIQMLRVERGRFFDAVDDQTARSVAVIGDSLAKLFYPGDIDPIGRTLQIDGRPFEVIGVLARKGPQLVVNWALHDDMVFVPLRAAEAVFGQGKAIDLLYANPRRLADIPEMNAEIRAALASRHRFAIDDKDALQVMSITEFSGTLQSIGLGLQVLLGGIGTVALAMAAVGVANLMIALVNDRRMELAVRRACGARRADLMLQLVIETMVVVLAGGACGVGAGALLAWAVGLLPLPETIPAPEPSWSVAMTTFVVLAAVGAVAGIVPARRAAAVDPAAAMRVT